MNVQPPVYFGAGIKRRAFLLGLIGGGAAAAVAHDKPLVTSRTTFDTNGKPTKTEVKGIHKNTDVHDAVLVGGATGVATAGGSYAASKIVGPTRRKFNTVITSALAALTAYGTTKIIVPKETVRVGGKKTEETKHRLLPPHELAVAGAAGLATLATSVAINKATKPKAEPPEVPTPKA